MSMEKLPFLTCLILAAPYPNNCGSAAMKAAASQDTFGQNDAATSGPQGAM